MVLSNREVKALVKISEWAIDGAIDEVARDPFDGQLHVRVTPLPKYRDTGSFRITAWGSIYTKRGTHLAGPDAAEQVA